VAAISNVDLTTVDDLARLELIARRLGIILELRGAPRELRELLDLAGLRDVVRCSDPLPVEVRGQAEQREEPRRVEEEADPGNPIARHLDDLE
jgi:hypothetical protein